MTVRVIVGSALDVLRTLESESVQVCVTSPPYFGLRAYGTDPQVWGGDPEHAHEWGTVPSPGSRSSDTKPGPLQHAGNTGRERLTSDLCACGAWRGELGLEPTPALFIEHLVTIFREIRRVLRPDGLVFCNLGDSYSNDAKWGGSSGGKHPAALHGRTGIGRQKRSTGVPAKSLFLIPERFAIAMQEDGWIVRSQIVWSKLSAMPESVKDRPTSTWEPIWMFAKSRTYYFDADAVRTPYPDASVKRAEYQIQDTRTGVMGQRLERSMTKSKAKAREYPPLNPNGAMMRNVWTLGPEPFTGEHYASFPTEIPKRCILAGTSEKGACPTCGAPWWRVVERIKHGERVKNHRTLAPLKDTGNHGTNGFDGNGMRYDVDYRLETKTLGWEQACKCPPADPVPCVVLDPFLGSGTTALVAKRLGRSCIGIELSPIYSEMARRRLESDAPLLGEPVRVEAPVQASLFGEAAS